MFEDLAQSATAVLLFALAGFSFTWLLSPLTSSWELARLRLSPRSMDERLSGQSLVGPVIILGGVGFIISGVVGWSVGMLMQDFDPIHFAESSTHINVTLVALAIFVVTAYLTNAYARFGAGKPTNLGERLYELQHRERGFYAPEHMDQRHWEVLRENTVGPWKKLNQTDEALLGRLLGTPLPEDPWNHIQQERVLLWRNAHLKSTNRKLDRALSMKLWKFHPAHWIRLGLLAVVAAGTLVLAIDSKDLSVQVTVLVLIGVGAVVVPPLIIRATSAYNRVRTATLARDLLWTQRTIKLIDAELDALLAPPSVPLQTPNRWDQSLLGLKSALFKAREPRK